MIIVKDEIRPDQYWQNPINIFVNNLVYSQIFEQTRLLRLKDGINKDSHYDEYNCIKEMALNVQNLVYTDKRFSVIQNIEIVKYPQGASKGFHFDNARDTTTGASITYLNDDYIGGQTVIEGVSVQPLRGRTVFFDGKQYKHNVMNVVKGCRYTLSIWYGYDLDGVLKDGF